ncbi:GGDEF domain-containing protein [Patescibacteria group bacterium]
MMTKLTPKQIETIAVETVAHRVERIPGWQIEEEKALRGDILDRVHARVETVMAVENMTPAERAAYVIEMEDRYEEMKELIKILLIDPLTGLNVRRYYEETLPRVIEENHPEISMLMVDVDYFKNINDAYGHAAGDFVLRELGKIVNNFFRKRDIKARYGGEEIAVVLPGCNLKIAHEKAEELRHIIEQHEFVFHPHGGMPFTIEPITVSIGVGELTSDEEGATDEKKVRLAKRADALVYAAKDLGRNRVAAQDGFDMTDLYARQEEAARKKKEGEILPTTTTATPEAAAGESTGESASSTPST